MSGIMFKKKKKKVKSIKFLYATAWNWNCESDPWLRPDTVASEIE